MIFNPDAACLRFHLRQGFELETHSTIGQRSTPQLPHSTTMAEHKARISCLATGNGSNLQALIDACQSGTILGTIVKVTVNRKDAYAVKRAEAANPPIPTDYFNLVKHGFLPAGEKDPERVKDARFKYDAALAERILADKPDLIVLAGWMHG